MFGRGGMDLGSTDDGLIKAQMIWDNLANVHLIRLILAGEASVLFENC